MSCVRGLAVYTSTTVVIIGVSRLSHTTESSVWHAIMACITLTHREHASSRKLVVWVVVRLWRGRLGGAWGTPRLHPKHQSIQSADKSLMNMPVHRIYNGKIGLCSACQATVSACSIQLITSHHGKWYTRFTRAPLQWHMLK